MPSGCSDCILHVIIQRLCLCEDIINDCILVLFDTFILLIVMRFFKFHDSSHDSASYSKGLLLDVDFFFKEVWSLLIVDLVSFVV